MVRIRAAVWFGVGDMVKTKCNVGSKVEVKENWRVLDLGAIIIWASLSICNITYYYIRGYKEQSTFNIWLT